MPRVEKTKVLKTQQIVGTTQNLNETSAININSNSDDYGSIPCSISQKESSTDHWVNRKEAVWNFSKELVKGLGLVYGVELFVTHFENLLIDPEVKSNPNLLFVRTLQYGVPIATVQYLAEDYIFDTIHNIKKNAKQLWTGQKELSEEIETVEELKEKLEKQEKMIQTLVQANEQTNIRMEQLEAKFDSINNFSKNPATYVAVDIESDAHKSLIEEDDSTLLAQRQDSQTESQSTLFFSGSEDESYGILASVNHNSQDMVY